MVPSKICIQFTFFNPVKRAFEEVIFIDNVAREHWKYPPLKWAKVCWTMWVFQFHFSKCSPRVCLHPIRRVLWNFSPLQDLVFCTQFQAKQCKRKHFQSKQFFFGGIISCIIWPGNGFFVRQLTLYLFHLNCVTSFWWNILAIFNCSSFYRSLIAKHCANRLNSSAR